MYNILNTENALIKENIRYTRIEVTLKLKDIQAARRRSISLSENDRLNIYAVHRKEVIHETVYMQISLIRKFIFRIFCAL